MVEETHTCTLCCNPDIPKRAPCCDCDADRTNCVLLATPPTTAAASRGVESHSSTSELNKAGLAVVLVVVALIAAVMTGIALFYLATRIRQRRIMYTPLNSTKGDMAATLALVEDSESGSEAELFARVGDT